MPARISPLNPTSVQVHPQLAQGVVFLHVLGKHSAADVYDLLQMG